MSTLASIFKACRRQVFLILVRGTDIFQCPVLIELSMNSPISPSQSHLLKKLVSIELKNIGKRIEENYNAELKYEDDTVDVLIAQSVRDAQGIKDIIDETVLVDVAEKILGHIIQAKPIHTVTISGDKKNNQLTCVIT